MKKTLLLVLTLLCLLAVAGIASADTYPAGRYTVGTDIPAGTYTITISSGSTNLTLWGKEYYDFSGGGGLLLNEVLSVRSNPTIAKVELKRGNVIDFSKPLIFEPYAGTSFNSYGSKDILPGRYTVGTDIPAGIYTITIKSGSTNLTLWGKEYYDFSGGGGLLLNEVLSVRSNPTIAKVELKRGNVIDFSAALHFEPYTGISFNSFGTKDVPPGRYTVGADIPAGTYTITVVSGSTNLTLWGKEYYDFNAGGGLLLNMVLSSRGPSSASKVELKNGNVIDFSATLRFEPYVGIAFSRGGRNEVPPGRYTVGTDIPAGTYTITVASGSTNLTVWGREYYDFRSGGGLLLNEVLSTRGTSSLSRVVLSEGNVIDFSTTLIFTGGY